MPADLDRPLRRPVSKVEPVRDDARSGPELGQQPRSEPPVHFGEEKQGDHRGFAQIGAKQVLLAKLDQALDSSLAGVAARALDHASVEVDPDAARAVIPRGGDRDAAIAGAKVEDDVGLRHAGKPKHRLDHAMRSREVHRFGFMHFGGVRLRGPRLGFTTVPFGPSIGEFLAWKWNGGGNKLRDEIYAKHGLAAVDVFCIGPETSGWFRKEVKSLAELKGMKMRFFGLGAQVMQKLGVSTQLLAAADIYPALERGVIDATEFSMPMMDVKLGFHQIAKFNYFPGWHQQVSCSELLMNKAAYDKLPDPYKAMIEVAGQAQVIVTFAESEAMQFGVMAEMRDKHKVQVKRWSDKDLATFEQAWLDVLKEESAKDATFKKVADHYLDFRKKYAIWGDSQAMKATYLGK